MEKVIYDYEYVFKDNGNKDGAIIYCHGHNSKPEIFEFFQNYWTKTNYYAIQFPGNNLVKPVKDHKLNVNQFVQLLVDFITNNGLKNVTLIGHSMGGGTISLAYKLCPDLISKLIYIAPINKTTSLSKGKYRRNFVPSTLSEYHDFLRPLYYDFDKLIANPEFSEEVKKAFDPERFSNENIKELTMSMDSSLYDQIESALDSIKVPTLLILGEKDGVIDSEACLEYFKEHVKNLESIIVPKSAHIIYLENWPVFIEAVEKFLSK
ncbi:alpha/beta hydrolase [Mycoplasmopsis agalactiae]|uniref:alpha/beta fold hydrolase n=1 Tax=Mycoplasmopsis agalactiae TaxID=2110 RepID=UPI00211C4F39|nr:alpha/beta hydrolase [Mycoplasmopsis agalactiae]UUM25760.1 alpha/beta hydrolase [Mycoplasmopsis agalactiae]